MKGLLLLLLVGTLAHATEPLNFESLLLLQTKEQQLSNPEWLEAWLSHTDPATLRKMKRHGRDDWSQKTLKKLTAELTKRRQKLLKEGVELQVNQSLLNYDKRHAATQLTQAFHRYLMTEQGKGNNNRFFKRGISALLLNPDQELRWLPFATEAAWKDWYQVREIEQGKRRARTVWVRYQLKPGKLIQPGLLELAIAGYVAEVEDYTRHKKIAESHWEVDFDQLRKQNPLAQGITSHLVPIHSLMMQGMSLGEVMVRFKPGACSEKPKIRDMRLFVCQRRDRGGHLQAEYDYLGGKMVRMREFRKVTSKDRSEQLIPWAQKTLGYPDAKWSAREWRKGRSLLRSIDWPDQPQDAWMVFEATHGEAPTWLKEDYKALP